MFLKNKIITLPALFVAVLEIGITIYFGLIHNEWNSVIYSLAFFLPILAGLLTIFLLRKAVLKKEGLDEWSELDSEDQNKHFNIYVLAIIVVFVLIFIANALSGGL